MKIPYTKVNQFNNNKTNNNKIQIFQIIFELNINYFFLISFYFIISHHHLIQVQFGCFIFSLVK